MNRVGMMVDLSKSSVKTMKDVLAIAEAPVIFSHSSSFELCNSSRNVQDEILQLVTKNRGLVMVNFYNKFLSCSEMRPFMMQLVSKLFIMQLCCQLSYASESRECRKIIFGNQGTKFPPSL